MRAIATAIVLCSALLGLACNETTITQNPMPDTLAQDTGAPDTVAPVDTAPDTVPPVDTAPDTVAPVDTAPDTTPPVDTAPDVLSCTGCAAYQQCNTSTGQCDDVPCVLDQSNLDQCVLQ